MALNKAALKAAILGLMTDMRSREENSDDEYAERLSDAIDAFVRTGEVPAGIAVSTTGSATSQTGTTTSTGTIV
ncbi:hypothetical protein ABDK00_016870 [Niabella insulamsoli]|uniref:hypothetical protein n=1 Tax=Niabella insulamsoli TaxID=3144874 RepID=UPI0031FD82E6